MISDGLVKIAAALRGEDDDQGPGTVWDDSRRIVAEVRARQEADYRQKLGRWEAIAPRRDAAMRAMAEAHERRRRELGLGVPEPGQIAAALDFLKPQPPHWMG